MERQTVLLKGIQLLQQSDKDIDNIIASRREDIFSLLERYINEIELFNPAYGLVGTDNREELIIKHILDSLAPLGILLRLLASNSSPNDDDTLNAHDIADTGSGAGLPGIPLAIALSHCNFSLIERMGRRAGFLCSTAAALALSNVTVEECEFEKAAPGRFNLVTFRAFKPLNKKLLKNLFDICKPNGIIAAYKGKREKIEAEMTALPSEQQAAIQWEAIPYTVPFLNEERHLLVVRKGDYNSKIA